MLLVMRPGEPDERAFHIVPGEATLGRTRDNTITCAHKSLSRRHATLRVESDRVRVFDTGSKNGVFIQGKRVREGEVRLGESFRCGDVTFLVARDEVAPTRDGPRPSVVAQTQPSPLGQPASPRAPRSTEIVAEPGDARYRERLFALVRISDLLVGHVDTETFLMEITGIVGDIVTADRVGVFVLDDETLELSPRAAQSFTSRPAPALSRRVAEWVADRGNPALFNDVSADTSLPGDPAVDLGIRAAMAAPINPGGGILGVMYADSLSIAASFRHDDLLLLKGIANLVALGLESRAHGRFTDQDLSTGETTRRARDKA